MAALARALAKEVKLPGYKNPYAGTKYTKKRKPASKKRTVTQKSNRMARTQVSPPQVSQDYRRTAVNYGKPKTATVRARKLTRQNINRTVYSLRHYGPWNAGSGQVDIASLQSGAPGTELRTPVHLWDLTAVPQGGGGSTIYYPAMFHELYFTDETNTADVRWYTSQNGSFQVQTDSKDSKGTILDRRYCFDQTYVTKVSDRSSTSNAGPGAISYIEKVRANLVLNGPQQKACKWCVQLVQLSDEVTPGVVSDMATEFWQGMAKPYSYNPLETGPRNHLRKHYKVLKSYYVNMDSPDSTEDHVQSRMRHLDILAFLNRRANYRWGEDGDKVFMDAADIPDDDDLALNNLFQTHVHPKARVYLMIRALCTFSEGAYSHNTQPSYDVKIDVTHRSFDS